MEEIINLQCRVGKIETCYFSFSAMNFYKQAEPFQLLGKQHTQHSNAVATILSRDSNLSVATCKFLKEIEICLNSLSKKSQTQK